MPLMKPPTKKAMEQSRPASLPGDLAVAYSVKRKAKKFAAGGPVSAKAEQRPMPDQRANDAKMAAHNSSKKSMPQGQWTDQPTVSQARKPSHASLSEPRMVASSVIKAKPLGMLKDDERHIEDTMAPDGYGKSPKKAYMFEGGVVSQDESEEDMVQHPAGLEEDDDQMSPAQSEYMAERFAEGGEVREMEMQPEPEADEEHHASVAAAIMARRKMYADGGMVDLDENATEEPNSFYDLNEHAALKENYDEPLHDVSQPEDSNLKGDESEAMESDRHDMVKSIRRKMKSGR